jgi:DNA-binding PadR family transcriptional regulator
MIRYLILGLLEAGGARHGYAFMKEYRDACGVEISIGNVYRELRLLVRKGWVRASTNPPGADSRRAPYAITGAGRIALDAWHASPSAANETAPHDELCLRVFLVTRAGSTMPDSLLERWQTTLGFRLKLLEQQRETMVARRQRNGHLGMLQLLIARRLSHLKADIDFLTQLRGVNSKASPQPRVARKPTEIDAQRT